MNTSVKKNALKIMPVFGTRPEAVKMCPLVNELKRRSGIETTVTVTGQHREMLDPVLNTFGVVPDHDLSVMKENQTLFDVTSSVLEGMRDVLEKEKPDVVLVHGDTTTAFAAALSAYYLSIPVGHVEAGLRTYDNMSPYPEEFNRQAIGSIALYHFAPTKLAASRLIREGKDREHVYITGNTVVDAMRHTVSSDYTHPALCAEKDKKLIFITAHRRENLGNPMRGMFRAIRRVLEEHPDLYAVYPVHKNPLVRSIAGEIFSGCPQVRLIEPLDVIDCHNFESRCYLCLTDSGGLQEECPSYGRPVLVMRNTTERPEGIEAGTLRLVGTEEESVYRAFKELIEDRSAYEKMARASNPFGDGKASERIADILEKGEYSPFSNS